MWWGNPANAAIILALVAMMIWFAVASNHKYRRRDAEEQARQYQEAPDKVEPANEQDCSS